MSHSRIDPYHAARCTRNALGNNHSDRLVRQLDAVQSRPDLTPLDKRLESADLADEDRRQAAFRNNV